MDQSGKKLYDTYKDFMQCEGGIFVDNWDELGPKEQEVWSAFEMEVAAQGWNPEF